MFKMLVVGMTALLSLNSFAIIELRGDHASLGQLPQSRGNAGAGIIQVARTSATSDKVSVDIRFNTWSNVCVRQAVRRVWVPGRRVRYCRMERRGNRQVRVCRWRQTPGRYISQTYCAQYRYAAVQQLETLLFDFNTANELAEGEREIFEISIAQKNLQSRALDYSGVVIQARSNYKITRRGGIFHRDGLNFMAW